MNRIRQPCCARRQGGLFFRLQRWRQFHFFFPPALSRRQSPAHGCWSALFSPCEEHADSCSIARIRSRNSVLPPARRTSLSAEHGWWRRGWDCSRSDSKSLLSCSPPFIFISRDFCPRRLPV